MKNHILFLMVAAGVGYAGAPAAAQEETDDAAMQIVGKMQVAVGKLKKLDTGKPTQTTQKQIVDSLDGLIAQLEKEREGMGRRGPRAGRPAPQSTIGSGPGGMGNLHAARQEGKDWGELPEHERDRILQSMTEGFPAHYQRILERYYKRLAQEAPVESAPEAAEPARDEQRAGQPPANPAPSGDAPAAGNER